MSYLYYAIYRFVLLTPSKNEQPEHIANITLALILSFALFGIVNLLEFFDINLTYNIWGNKLIFIGLYLTFLAAGYFLFIRNKRYIVLRQKFGSQGKKRKIINLSLVVAFLILLVILNFFINP